MPIFEPKKTTINGKNLLCGLKSRMRRADERVSEFKDRQIEIILSEKQSRKSLKKINTTLEVSLEQCYKRKKANICANEIIEEEKKEIGVGKKVGKLWLKFSQVW